MRQDHDEPTIPHPPLGNTLRITTLLPSSLVLRVHILEMFQG